MLRKYLIPLLALAGIAFAILTVIRGDKTPPPMPPFSAASRSPYPTSVAGSGLVEASTENILIGTPIAGIIAKIFVHVGEQVKRGDSLFMIDDRAQRANYAVHAGAVEIAEAQLADAYYELKLAEGLAAKGVGTIDDRKKQTFAARKAEAQVSQARAELSSSQIDLERLTVRAPVDGEVLQLKAHLGEFAPLDPAAVGQSPLLMLGSVSPLYVRVDVDENDAWRIPGSAAATGFIRGRPEIKTPLTFVRFEPYILPKKSLTGDSTERVDTRVLQVIFSFSRGDLPIFVGQQMDVWIETPTTGGQSPKQPERQ